MTDLYAHPFNHLPQVTGGVFGGPLRRVADRFFRSLREQDKKYNTAIHNIGDMEGVRRYIYSGSLTGLPTETFDTIIVGGGSLPEFIRH